MPSNRKLIKLVPIAGCITRRRNLRKITPTSSSNQDEEGRTQLHVTVLNNQVKEVRELLQDYSEYTEIKDKNDKYPYQYAIDNGNIEILKLFLHYYTTVEPTEQKQVNRWNSVANDTFNFARFMGLTAVMFWNINRGKRPEEAEAHTYDTGTLVSYIALILPSVDIGYCAYIGYCKSRPQRDQIGEKPKEIYSAILKVAVLNNQVKEIRELLQDYSEYTEIKDKNDKYPYQYAIDNGNMEILKLFSNYYPKRKAEVERTVRKFEGKVAQWGYVKKVNMRVSICINICFPLYVGITSLVAKSKTDILKNSLSSFIAPTFYKIYQYILGVKNNSLNTNNKIIEILFDLEQQKCKNLTDEAKLECIKGKGVIEDLLNQGKNSALELSKEIKWMEGEVAELNIYKGDIAEAYRTQMKTLEEFVDYHSMAISIFSIFTSLTGLSYSIIEGIHSHYSGKCTSQHELLNQVNENLNEIKSKINELKMEDRLIRKFNERLSGMEQYMEQRLAEIEMKLGNLQSSTEASSNVRSDDSQSINAIMQEIRTNMEDVEVASAFASKSTRHRRSNERT